MHFNTDIDPEVTYDKDPEHESPNCHNAQAGVNTTPCLSTTTGALPVVYEHYAGEEGDYDPWTSYYAMRSQDNWTNFYASTILQPSSLFPLSMAPGKIWHESKQEGELQNPARLPILIDLGSSGTAGGMSWLHEWGGAKDLEFPPSHRSFRYGDGKLIPIIGTYSIPILSGPSIANQSKPCAITITADVVQSSGSLLISKRSLVEIRINLDFRNSLIEVDGGLVIYLRNLKSGRICIPVTPMKLTTRKTLTNTVDVESTGSYPSNPPLAMKPITDQQILNIHMHLARCSEFAMTNLPKASGRVDDKTKIRRFIRNCICEGVLGRITLPKVTGWLAGFHGGIIGIDVIYHFVGFREGVTGKQYMALLIVG